ncbi:MAG: hypothetical protein AAFU85_06520 [Planctomycetota bacterium]
MSSRRCRRWAATWITFTLACAGLLTQTGCMGLVANLVHATGADKVPAAYDGLKGSRVAIVTVTENGMFQDDISARILGRNVTQWLKENVKKVEVVREEKITDWRDTHGWDQIDFTDIGRGVDAEKVVGIEVANLKLRDGATLYRGRADVEVKVIDVSTGEVVYRHTLEDFTYPETAGQYTSETTESRFRKLYLGILAKRVARQFYPYDYHEDFALDSIVAR